MKTAMDDKMSWKWKEKLRRSTSKERSCQVNFWVILSPLISRSRLFSSTIFCRYSIFILVWSTQKFDVFRSFPKSVC